ncbi:MAG: Uma2 family endonuclease [Deltaproteobacteria bacterium]|nr:Uma2 family endonuclease [Deltaproteobacteria bacterium]
MPLPGEHPEIRYTYGDYLTWPDGERWELFGGEPRAMTPGPNRRHQELLISRGSTFHAYLVGKTCRVYPAPFDVRLSRGAESDEAVDTVVQPDLLVVCDPAKLDDRVCRGAPDLVVEITSPSTASLDPIRKKTLYERHGVREYWLVHPVDRVVMVYRLGADGAFGAPAVYGPEDTIPVGLFDDLTVDLREVFRE